MPFFSWVRATGVAELVAGLAGSGVKCSATGGFAKVDVGSRLVEAGVRSGVVRTDLGI